MPDRDNLSHIRLEGHTTSEKYTAFSQPRDKAKIKERDRSQHGNALKRSLQQIKERYQELQEAELPASIVREDAIYVEFISDYDVELAIDSLDSGKGLYSLLSSKKLEVEVNGEVHKQYRAVVMLTEGGISAFIKKVEEYLTANTKGTIKNPDGLPKNQKLIANISQIRQATLQSFWNEPSNKPFPEPDDNVWWEVWLRRKSYPKDDFEDAKVIAQVDTVGARIADRRLLFPEHIVRLVKATPMQLSGSLVLLDNLAELRKPQETAEFFTRLGSIEEQEWVQELAERVENKTVASSFAICVLDTGANNRHMLLNRFLPDENMDTIKPEWGTADGERFGHGTQMAGLALYGDLTPLLGSTEGIQIYHQLESIKLIDGRDPHEPELYGSVTEEATARALLIAPERNRLFCMAITSKEGVFHGRPSSWSSSIDKITFGVNSDLSDKYLFLVSGGNVFLHTPQEYIINNELESIQDPGQSYNCLTVGAFTEKDYIDLDLYPGASPLAQRGGMSPRNSTSLLWENSWAIKPDIVMEGGNFAVQRGDIIEVDSLQLLTTNKDYTQRLLTTFGDTSGATALASNFAAQLAVEYPDFWPETIRGLIVHSAEWTDAMLNYRRINELNQNDKRSLLRSYGYGVPNLNKARYSASISLTLIAEREIQPYYLQGSDVKTNDMHIFQLPWPTDILLGLGAYDVRLNLTLSYFIEPNPGNKRYSSKFFYQSHGLRFKMNSPSEPIEDFRRRVSKIVEDEDQNSSAFSSESWALGNRLRDKGSLHKDFWQGSAAELATRNLIAVYPVNGWYRTRKKLNKYNSTVRYSLIISIEAPGVDVDIYTPIANQIAVTL